MTSFYLLGFVVLFLSLNSNVSSRDVSSRDVKWAVDDNSDLVTNLPGQPPVYFKHYAGYVNVNETNGRSLFYWFFEALTEPENKPLLLWLNGGPGCSSVGYGATEEIGPFLVDIDGKCLKYNNFSWNREANLLFLESPIGVGFSYSNTTSEYQHLGDDFTANDTYTFLHKWFLKFPSYRTRSFYIGGESYGGHYVPQLAQVILDRNNEPSLHIDLKGILVGNPEISYAEDWWGMIDYAWSHAVISDETHKIIRENCQFNNTDNTSSSNDVCNKGLDEMFKQYNEIDIYSLYTPVCLADKGVSKPMQKVMKLSSNKDMIPRIMGGYDPCIDHYATTYFNIPEVQKALHASDGHNLKNWSICNDFVFNNWEQSARTVIPVYSKLISAGLRVWIYSGDTDGRVPVLSTRYSINLLGLPITKPWNPWYNEKEVSGWYQEYKGLTFATFRGAGHDVPTFKPSNSLVFFTSFLLGESLPSKR
ncbi:serine carboxypeptidase-like 32 [Vicia villosa]|uniref:serine carboxypeptidase-like 32 n=1 Tax=Vicia villosa TaxID=3911 RepID=UPI00273BCE95|nr:serine carboxypeptidase-like 32 [Vicia villosa]